MNRHRPQEGVVLTQPEGNGRKREIALPRAGKSDRPCKKKRDDAFPEVLESSTHPAPQLPLISTITPSESVIVTVMYTRVMSFMMVSIVL